MIFIFEGKCLGLKNELKRVTEPGGEGLSLRRGNV